MGSMRAPALLPAALTLLCAADLDVATTPENYTQLNFRNRPMDWWN